MHKYKICPLAVYEGKVNLPVCAGSSCAWYCDFAKQCAIPLLACMFADSDLCKNTFDVNDDTPEDESWKVCGNCLWVYDCEKEQSEAYKEYNQKKNPPCWNPMF